MITLISWTILSVIMHVVDIVLRPSSVFITSISHPPLPKLNQFSYGESLFHFLLNYLYKLYLTNI